MRHILLVLPFLLPDLVRPEVEEYNRLNPAEEPLVDPSSDCIDVTLLLLTWYRLFRRCDPPKDEEDIKELNELADWYLNIPKYFLSFTIMRFRILLFKCEKKLFYIVWVPVPMFS